MSYDSEQEARRVCRELGMDDENDQGSIMEELSRAKEAGAVGALRELGVRLGMDSHAPKHTADAIYEHVLWLENRAYTTGL